mmetsp:Transcript_7257/g.22129  ORF Transcript_7257/g.22129 Transcript_7257/m.22129 type:complete len:400 (-) Transcript_7257:200-1399(-)
MLGKWCVVAWTWAEVWGLSTSGRPRSGRRRPPVDRSSRPLEEWGAFRVPNRIGISTVAWGDPDCGFTRARKRARVADQFGKDDITAAYETLMAGGIDVFDVAAGSAGSRILGQCAKTFKRSNPRVVARCAPSLLPRLLSLVFPLLRNRAGATGVADGVRRTLRDVSSAYVDLLLWGPAGLSRSALIAATGASAAKDLQSRGLVSEVGVANVRGGRKLRAAHRALERQGLRCVACTVDLSLIESGVLDDGTLEAARELDITVLARSPLARGLGSGKYTIFNPSGGAGFPKWRPRVLFRFQPIHDALVRVADLVSKRRTDKARSAQGDGGQPAARVVVTPAQVALQWVIAKGAVPLVSCNKEAYATEILGCKEWALTQEEVDILDEVRKRRMPIFKSLPRR